jgi:hypothetical protein
VSLACEGSFQQLIPEFSEPIVHRPAPPVGTSWGSPWVPQMRGCASPHRSLVVAPSPTLVNTSTVPDARPTRSRALALPPRRVRLDDPRRPAERSDPTV